MPASLLTPPFFTSERAVLFTVDDDGLGVLDTGMVGSWGILIPMTLWKSKLNQIIPQG
jgi:hypothetical protein